MSKAEQYRSMLLRLFPRGIAFPRHIGTALAKVVHAFADEFARVDGRAADLLRELPQDATETLSDWERVTGATPEPGEDIATRRATVVGNLRAVPDNSPPGIVAVLESFGITATVHEYSPFFVSVDTVGEAVAGEDWELTYVVRIYDAPTVPLAAAEEIVNRITPAHTVVLFEYITT